MTWQKVESHIHDERISVKSKSGNVYPVDTRKTDGQMVYSHMVNEKNDWDLWAWVEFEGDDGPVCEYVSTGSPSGGPPEKPPWDL